MCRAHVYLRISHCLLGEDAMLVVVEDAAVNLDDTGEGTADSTADVRRVHHLGNLARLAGPANKT